MVEKVFACQAAPTLARRPSRPSKPSITSMSWSVDGWLSLPDLQDLSVVQALRRGSLETRDTSSRCEEDKYEESVQARASECDTFPGAFLRLRCTYDLGHRKTASEPPYATQTSGDPDIQRFERSAWFGALQRAEWECGENVLEVTEFQPNLFCAFPVPSGDVPVASLRCGAWELAIWNSYAMSCGVGCQCPICGSGDFPHGRLSSLMETKVKLNGFDLMPANHACLVPPTLDLLTKLDFGDVPQGLKMLKCFVPSGRLDSTLDELCSVAQAER